VIRFLPARISGGTAMLLSPDDQRQLLDAARTTIRAGLRGDRLPDPTEEELSDPALSQPAGCFVTLHRLDTHELRGCVGRLDAVDPLIVAVRRAAASVLHDPRFADNPVRPGELGNLQIDISVLSPLRPAAHPLDFDLLDDGIYLTWENRAGCFLPQVARETGWSKEQLLARLCVEKMGLPAHAWQDPRAKLHVFKTVIVGPEPFETQPRRGERM
jgi:AmmeMemoRadiSam system protein A